LKEKRKKNLGYSETLIESEWGHSVKVKTLTVLPSQRHNICQHDFSLCVKYPILLCYKDYVTPKTPR